MDNLEPFQAFKKIPRLSREIVITEKIDGSNAQVFISEDLKTILAGSRNRWLTPEDDNFGFATWVSIHKDELLQLGPGRHFGEWWGVSIQRHYNLSERRFSLFNTYKWTESRPACCHVVPILYQGPMETVFIDHTISRLKEVGSLAAPGFMKPEGIIIYHSAGNLYFKKTVENDEMPKGKE